MSDPHRDSAFPRGPLLGAGALVAVSLMAVTLVRVTGLETTFHPAPVEVARELRFTDRPDGGVAVYDAADDTIVQVLEPGTNGFIRATLRGLARDRRPLGVGAETPFRLAERTDGRLTLEDPATGRLIELTAFGSTNATAFARLLADASERQ